MDLEELEYYESGEYDDWMLDVHTCPKCGREYLDEAAQDFGICDYCGWSSMEDKYLWE